MARRNHLSALKATPARIEDFGDLVDSLKAVVVVDGIKPAKEEYSSMVPATSVDCTRHTRILGAPK